MRFLALISALVPGFMSAQIDTNVLSIGNALNLVRYNHPMAKQARLTAQGGEAYLRYARGSFDPKIYLEQQNKYFSGKNYYSITESGIKVPTWFGAEFSAGWEQNNGAFLNPEDVTPAGGLSKAGISMPLMRNLLTDARRTQLRKAQLLRERTLFERDQELNGLAASVVRDYVTWFFAWREVELYQTSVELLAVRMQAVRTEFEAGGRSAADTIETAAQLAQFRLSLTDALLGEQKARLAFSVHMWNDQGRPVELNPKMRPSSAGLEFLDSMTSAYPDSLVCEKLLNEQPELAALDLYVRELELEKRYKQQLLLPDLTVKYNLLSPAWYNFNANTGSPTDNYTFGLNFSSSLFLRKERGDYQLALYKYQGADLKLQQKNVETNRKVRALYAQVNTYRSIGNQYAGVVESFNTLYENEKIRFSAGDATVFMVNTRENKLLETRLKQLDYIQKLRNSQADYLEKSGLLWQTLR